MSLFISKRIHAHTHTLLLARKGRTRLLLVAVALLVGFGASQLIVQHTHADSINSTDFVTTWKVDEDWTRVTIRTQGSGYNYNVDWDNDGVPDVTNVKGDITHDFEEAGEYTIRISGEFPRIYNRDGYNDHLIDIKQWGDIKWSSMAYAFSGTTLGEISATDTPNLSSVTDMTAMFSDARSFSGNLSDWDVSNVTNMRAAFQSTSLSSDLSNWDVSNVTDMSRMFSQARSFSSDLSDWEISNVTDMEHMLDHSGISVENYENLLVNWAKQDVNSGVTLGVEGVVYCDTTGRNMLIDDHDWSVVGDFECETPADVVVDGESRKYVDNNTPANTDLGALNTKKAYGAKFSIECEDGSSEDNISFSIREDEDYGNQHLVTSQKLVSNESTPRVYTVCIKATKKYGAHTKTGYSRIAIIVQSDPDINNVSFSIEDGRPIVTVNGHGFIKDKTGDDDIFWEAMTRSLVELNRKSVPFCTDGTSLTVDDLLDAGVRPGLMSESPTCYYLLNAENGAPKVLFTDEEVKIWLSDSFDTTKQGTISVNGSPEFVFNKSSGSDDSGDTPSGDKVSAAVNGKPLKKSQTPTITKRPTFSGKAPALSYVKVTVHSDPVTCETTADANGNWSCTLPKDLEPGLHTVKVVIRTTDNKTITLDDYKVRVPNSASDDDKGASSSNPSANITASGKVPGTPNTGIVAAIVDSSVTHGMSLSIVALVMSILGAIGIFVHRHIRRGSIR